MWMLTTTLEVVAQPFSALNLKLLIKMENWVLQQTSKPAMMSRSCSSKFKRSWSLSNVKMKNLALKILRLISFISASENTLWFKINYTKTS